MLDIFLELASTKIGEEPASKSEYAGPLYKWLELIESCRVTMGGLALDEEEQQQNVARVLADSDVKMADSLLRSIQNTSLGAIDAFKNRRRLTPAFPVIVTIDFDNEDRMVFRYGMALSGVAASEKGVTLIVFFNLIGHMRLEPERFQICPKCGKHFYQYQRKSQKYCSRSCSDMGRSGKMYSPPI